MPLQNRVTPFGEIVAHPARGMFMGNRGILHDSARHLHPARRWTHKSWICCLCAFKGRRRVPMTPGRYTELFFLDEATALAAGHRPCFECRRADAQRFTAAWSDGNGTSSPSAKDMDAVMHGERLDRRKKRLHPLPAPPGALPDGAMVADENGAYLVLNGELLPWSFDGYAPPVSDLSEPKLLTPPSIVGALAGGYRPALHPSARGD